MGAFTPEELAARAATEKAWRKTSSELIKPIVENAQKRSEENRDGR